MKRLAIAASLVLAVSVAQADDGVFVTAGFADKNTSLSAGFQYEHFGLQASFIANGNSLYNDGVGMTVLYFPFASGKISPFIGVGHYAQTVRRDVTMDLPRIEATDIVFGFTYESVGIELSRVRGVSLKYKF